MVIVSIVATAKSIRYGRAKTDPVCGGAEEPELTGVWLAPVVIGTFVEDEDGVVDECGRGVCCCGMSTAESAGEGRVCEG